MLLPFLWLYFQFLSIFNFKVRQGIHGRKVSLKNVKIPENPVIIHSSSFGEYQQAIPIIEELRKQNKNVILTFFSPSGYNNAKIYDSGIQKFYLPFDFLRNVNKFLDYIKPAIIILIRYDLWFNFLYAARKKKIKVILANARFDKNDIFWKLPFTRSFKKIIHSFIDNIFVINEFDEINYKEMLDKSKTEIVKLGDSKFERVQQFSKNIEIKNILPENIIKEKKVFVIGSSWKDDEDFVLPVINKIIEERTDLLTVLVPHEPKETKIKAIEKNIYNEYRNIKTIRYSEIEKYNGENLIIVDSVGKLMAFYSISYFSYVGGGFRTGLHNILEPVAFNVPVFFSNKCKNSDEDELIIKFKCGIITEDKKKFYSDFKELLTNPETRNNYSNNCMKVFDNTYGVAKNIVENI
jgi:3-deoxy-D-manno-octulosonic-acid transferase